MVYNRLGFSIKHFSGMIAVTALLLCGEQLAAKELQQKTSGKDSASGSSQAPVPRADEAEEPISSGTPFSWEDADKVQNGMTEAEVVGILGKPFSRRESGGDAILIWSYTVGEASNAVAYRFLNGRVISIHRIRS